MAGILILLAWVAGCSSDQSPDSHPSSAFSDYPEAEREITFDLGNNIKMELVLIPPGSFRMGDRKGQDDEKPVHRVTITKPFYLGKYEVTQEQWEAVMGTNPSHFKGAKNPVECVSWHDCRSFLDKLNHKFKDSEVTFRLPTEAEWEYACRAGSTTRWSFGDDPESMTEYGWFRANCDSSTHPAGQKKPNPWGLYDMYGNVYEWCSDWYADDYYRQSPKKDPAGPQSGSQKVIRGGCWCHDPMPCRSAVRCGLEPSHGCVDEGLRVVVPR